MSNESTIRRGVRNARYAAIPNHVFEDARLSMEARWLLSYLLSKPDNWTVVIGDIIKKGNCGRDKARGMIAELVKWGYAKRDQQRADGKFGSSVLVIYDEPLDLPDGDASGESGSVAFLPQTDLPATAMPAPAKSAHSNNLDSANTDNQQGREGAGADCEDPKKIERDFWALVKDWPGFAGMPKEPAKAPFMRLTADERRMAIERFPAWLAMLKAQKKSHVPAPSTYFQQKLFLDVADRTAEPMAAQMHNAFSKAWMALWLSEFCKPMATAFPAPSGFQRMEMRDAERAKAIELERRAKYGWPKAASMAAEPKAATVPSRIAALGEPFERMHRDSDRFQLWREAHHRLGLPWLADTGHEWFFFPAGEPAQAMAALKAAISEGRDDDAA